VTKDHKVSDLISAIANGDDIVLLWKGRVLRGDQVIGELQHDGKLDLSACRMNPREDDEIRVMRREIKIQREGLERIRQRLERVNVNRGQEEDPQLVRNHERIGERARVFVFRLNLNFNFLMRLVIFWVLLSSEPELAYLAMAGMALYVLSYIIKYVRNRRRNADGNAQQPGNQNAQPQVRRYRPILPANESGSLGFIVTLEKFIYGLFASLYPDWQPEEVPETPVDQPQPQQEPVPDFQNEPEHAQPQQADHHEHAHQD
jgi:hypothetical protein